MDLKKNKFLTAFLAVLGAGVLALGFLCWTGYSAYSKAKEEFDGLKTEVSGLESKPLFPNDANLKKRQDQVNAYAGKVDELQKALLKYQIPLEAAPDENKFQPKLNSLIQNLKQTAEGNGTKLYEGFDLGLGAYQASIPKRAALADLYFQLEGINSLVSTLLAARVASIDGITRKELDVEADVPASAEKPKAGTRNSGREATAAPAVTETDIYKRYPIIVRFSGTPRAVEEVINGLSTAPEGGQFFALRAARVENAKKDGPSQGSVPEAPGGDASAPKQDFAIVLGGERIHMQLYIDLLRFIDPAAAAAKAAADKEAAKAPAAKPVPAIN